MRRLLNQTLGLASVLVLMGSMACSDRVDAGGAVADAGVDDDPLTFEYNPAEGSLEDIYRTIIAKRCSGQPGLCHNSQFEPNLSSPGNAYAYLVNRPGLEKPDRLRVEPGNPGNSLIIDKIRGRDVSTVMPLGAEPLTEAEIAKIEAWIANGALRRPGAAPAPVLNNPPKDPEIGVFNAAGTRLDQAGSYPVTPGTALTFRHSVADFETADADIPFAVFILQNSDGRNVALEPASSDPNLGYASYNPSGPQGNGDILNWEFTFTIGATITLRDGAGNEETVSSSGLTLTLIAFYADEFPTGILSFAVSNAAILVQ